MRVYGYVMATVYQWRKKTGAKGPVIINSTKGEPSKVGTPHLNDDEQVSCTY
jgi:hypothetical protein